MSFMDYKAEQEHLKQTGQFQTIEQDAELLLAELAKKREHQKILTERYNGILQQLFNVQVEIQTITEQLQILVR